MDGFFYRSDSERKRISLIQLELARVGALINQYEKQRNGYMVPKHFEVNWIFYTASDGNVQDEILLRENFTTVQILERVLFKQIKGLKDMEAMYRNKH